jgi:hypothetical protein
MKQIIGAFLIVLLAGPVLAQPLQPDIPGWGSGRHEWRLQQEREHWREEEQRRRYQERRHEERIEWCRHHPRHGECR